MFKDDQYFKNATFHLWMSTAFSLNPVDNRIVIQKSIRIDKKKKATETNE